MTILTNAGYICHTNETILGVGATADDAWDDMVSNLEPGFVLVERGESPPDTGANWCYARNYSLSAATAALIEQVRHLGGDIAWSKNRGIACTKGEAV